MHLSARKLILALLYAPGKKGQKEAIEGKTRFEKLMFLTTNQKFVDLLRELNYQADNFGPNSDILIDQIENLKDFKLVDIEYKEDKKKPDIYKLTTYGEAYAKKIFEKDLDSDDREFIKKIKQEFNSIPLDTLLRHVYNTVDRDKWLKNSEIKDKYLTSMSYKT